MLVLINFPAYRQHQQEAKRIAERKIQLLGELRDWLEDADSMPLDEISLADLARFGDVLCELSDKCRT